MLMSTLPIDDESMASQDTLKVPQSAPHHWAMDLIAQAARGLLGSEFHVFADMNWYHPDYPHPVAPDVMVIPAGGVEPRLRSYQQGGGVSPTVVVEIPSENNTAFEVQKKNLRYKNLGVVTIAVYIEPGTEEVLRRGPDDQDLRNWTGRPIPELGGLALDFDKQGILRATTPDGYSGTSHAEILHAIHADQQAAAEANAAAAEANAAEAEAKMAAMAEQLRAAGIEPATEA